MTGINDRILRISLTRKFNRFTESITDPAVKKLVRDNSMITGGAIASLKLGETINDYDVYFTNKETCLAVAKYYANLWNSGHPNGEPVKVLYDDHADGRIKLMIQSIGVVQAADESGDPVIPEDANAETTATGQDNQNKGTPEKYKPIFISSNAITLSDKIQLIVRFYGNPEKIHKNYDFIHCTNYWLSANGSLHLNTGALSSLLCKQLVYTGSLYPLCSIFRAKKFLLRGWKINAGQYLKMALQVSKLDLYNVNVLEDQLIGVDTAYFQMMIEAIRKDSPSETIDNQYLISLIDTMF
jgi:hypothetical protein